MRLQGMSDATFESLIQETENIQFLMVVKLNRMATKTAIENVLMAKFGLDRADAHTFTNTTESRNVRTWTKWGGKLVWALKRAEPILADYPELRISE